MSHLLPEGADLQSAVALLDAHLDVRAGRARSVASTFYDSFDGRLHGDGLMLRHAEDRLALIDRATGETLVAAEAAVAPRLFDADLPAALRERLADVIEMRALTPVARVRGRELALAVRNGDEKTVVRLKVETYASGQAPLRGRISSSAVRGY
jgi:hypothetical protein